MAQVTLATLALRLEVVETLDDVASLSDLEPIRHGAFDRIASLTPGSTWSALRCVTKEHTFDDSLTWDLDFTAAPGSQGNMDLTGYKLVAWLFGCPSTNVDNVVIDPAAASNPFSAYNAGGQRTLGPEETEGGYRASGFAVVASGHRVLRFTGAEDDQVKAIAVFGLPAS